MLCISSLHLAPRKPFFYNAIVSGPDRINKAVILIDSSRHNVLSGTVLSLAPQKSPQFISMECTLNGSVFCMRFNHTKARMLASHGCNCGVIITV